MSLSPHDIAIRWFEEVWNKGRLEAVDELATPDAKSYGFPQPESVLSREQFKEYVLEFRRSCGHIPWSVDAPGAVGGGVAVRWAGTMRQTGSGIGCPPPRKTV